ncbi:MAG TPA: zinc metalloprotease HtpX [Vicinamibacteria bacterium]|jgi:heat shock protein HtpX|nr:zinc metalloprotease HtpX [Vicinamibacteria bacterium]
MNALKTTFLLGALTGLLLAIGEVLGGHDGLTLALILAGVMNFGAWFWSDKIVLRMYNAQPVGPSEAPELYAIVEGLARKAGIPMPKLYLIPDPALNAFATGRGPSHAAVAATAGIVKAMDREELEGVLAHELSHVINRDTLVATVAATLAGAISFLARSLMFRGRGRDEGGNPLAALLVMIVAPVAAMLIQLAVSRSREYGADASGARLVGYPDGLARALGKLREASERVPMQNVEPATAHLFIVNPLSGRALGRWFSTHPPLEERIERLMAMKGQLG